MQIIKTVGYRIFHLGLGVGTRVLHFPEPELLSGAGSIKKLPEKIKSYGLKNILIVTGKHVSLMPQFEQLLTALQSEGIRYTVFKDVSPNPTVKNAETACEVYTSQGCDGMIAFGGGSPIDCAKICGVLVNNQGKSIRQFRGLFKVGNPIPPLFAIPTTSGSGSETTIAAVITDDENHDKFAVNDPKLTPLIAVLDPELTVSLPASVTATTGMDALTHAIEAYIGRCGTKYTDEKAENAVALIFDSLLDAYSHGDNLEAREHMAQASFSAGCAFTRAFVGYVHAIAHALGGLYNTPHGLANAVILPYVLDFYGESAYEKLSKLARITKIDKETESPEQLTKQLISRIREMNRIMDIPECFKELRREDIPILAAHALHEANPAYPVPKIMDLNQCEKLLELMLPQ